MTDAGGQLGRLPPGTPLLVATSAPPPAHGPAAGGTSSGGRFYDAVLVAYQVCAEME